MTVVGQTRKSSPRANVVRCSSINGLNSDITACLKRILVLLSLVVKYRPVTVASETPASFNNAVCLLARFQIRPFSQLPLEPSASRRLCE